jgi:hypothetical protein
MRPFTKGWATSATACSQRNRPSHLLRPKAMWQIRCTRTSYVPMVMMVGCVSRHEVSSGRFGDSGPGLDWHRNRNEKLPLSFAFHREFRIASFHHCVITSGVSNCVILSGVSCCVNPGHHLCVRPLHRSVPRCIRVCVGSVQPTATGVDFLGNLEMPAPASAEERCHPVSVRRINLHRQATPARNKQNQRNARW